MAAHAHQRIHPRHRVLEHQSHGLAPQLPQLRSPELAWILAGQGQPSFTDRSLRQQLHHGPRHRAFAAA